MPEMVMQMPGRHGSLSAPFLMDQIIQTAVHTIASLCCTYIWNPKEHFCSLVLTLVGYFTKHAPMRGALFSNGDARSLSQAHKHNSSLFLPRHPDPADALCTAVWDQKYLTSTIKPTHIASLDEAYIASVAGCRDQSLSYGSQGTRARWNREHLFKYWTHWVSLSPEQSKLISGNLQAWPSMQHMLDRNVYCIDRGRRSAHCLMVYTAYRG